MAHRTLVKTDQLDVELRCKAFPFRSSPHAHKPHLFHFFLRPVVRRIFRLFKSKTCLWLVMWPDLLRNHIECQCAQKNQRVVLDELKVFLADSRATIWMLFRSDDAWPIVIFESQGTTGSAWWACQNSLQSSRCCKCDQVAEHRIIQDVRFDWTFKIDAQSFDLVSVEVPFPKSMLRPRTYVKHHLFCSKKTLPFRSIPW